MTTANQMMRTAEQKAKAQQLHEVACRDIPGRTVVVVSEIDGSGKIEIIAIPGVVNGPGGTADVLSAALRELGGYEVTKIPTVSVLIPARNSHTGTTYRRDIPIDPAVAEVVRRLNHPANGEEAITAAACSGHGKTWPSIHLADGNVLLMLPAGAAEAMQQLETARRLGLPYEIAGLDNDSQAMYLRVLDGLGLPSESHTQDA
jgi:hypothetical protein